MMRPSVKTCAFSPAMRKNFELMYAISMRFFKQKCLKIRMDIA
jgi:hypothetical protein